MKRILLGGGALTVLAVAVLISQAPRANADRANSPNPADELKIVAEAKNPWTNLQLNDAPDQFQFAVISDRTGGHRAKVYSRAVQQINLLQPTFVMSVGDLVEGYTQSREQATSDWDEFDRYTKQFRMPFFYVPGNHDLATNVLSDVWKERYGRQNYHFVYKNTLFLALNCEDMQGKQRILPQQQEEIKKALEANPGVRWTFLFVHEPIWTARDLEANGWLEVEKLLAGRKYTVFCGHLHRYQKYVRNGMNYYQLATTGGGSRMRGVEYGEFDQVAWVTVKKGAPVIANIVLDGVLPESLETIPSDEPGRPVRASPVPLHPATATVTFQGKPAPGATVLFFTTIEKPAPGKSKYKLAADGLTMADGKARLTTISSFDGIAAGEYIVAVIQTGGYRKPGELDKLNKFPAKYSSASQTPFKATVTADGKNEFHFEVTE
ncbi:MAG: metallophosphoesterase [Bacteroidales bacterium]|nr:metallophosphoesterase [Bacteroidales bacterium]